MPTINTYIRNLTLAQAHLERAEHALRLGDVAVQITGEIDVAFSIRAAERTEPFFSHTEEEDSIWSGLPRADEQLSLADDGQEPFSMDDDGAESYHDLADPYDQEDDLQRLHNAFTQASRQVRRTLAGRRGARSEHGQTARAAFEKRAAFARLSTAIDAINEDIKDARYLELCDSAKAVFDAWEKHGLRSREQLLSDDFFHTNPFVATDFAMAA